jgi:hypothetical protein
MEKKRKERKERRVNNGKKKRWEEKPLEQSKQ